MGVRMGGSVLCRCMLLLGPVVWRASAATDPAGSGAFPAARLTAGIPGSGGQTLTTDVFFPGTTAAVAAAAAPCPAVAYGHGFSQSKAQYANLGLHLASRGFIALIPDFNGGSDHARNGEDLRRCLDWIVARNADTQSVFLGRVRTDRLGVSGHSAGGLSAILAAAQDARIAALSLMDPVDNGGQGVTALPAVRAPVALTWSEPSSCNANGSAVTLYAAAPGLRRGVKVVGANHTDPQDPPGALSILFCGAANTNRQALYRRYTVGWFEYFLHDDASYLPWAFAYPGGQVSADLAAGRITQDAPLAPLLLSGSPADAGVVVAVTGPAGQRYALEGAAEPAGWSALRTNQLGAVPDGFTNAAPTPSGFFRTLSLP